MCFGIAAHCKSHETCVKGRLPIYRACFPRSGMDGVDDGHCRKEERYGSSNRKSKKKMYKVMYMVDAGKNHHQQFQVTSSSATIKRAAMTS